MVTGMSNVYWKNWNYRYVHIFSNEMLFTS